MVRAVLLSMQNKTGEFFLQRLQELSHLPLDCPVTETFQCAAILSLPCSIFTVWSDGLPPILGKVHYN